MKLKEFREKMEKGFEAASLEHQDKNTGDVYVLIDDTSLEKGDLVVEVRRYYFDGTKWDVEIKYSDNDYQCGMSVFDECLNDAIVDPLDGLGFICPSCKGTRLECVMDGVHESEVLCIDPDGDFEFADTGAGDECDRFQCLICGFTLKANVGHGDYNIIDHEEVVAWIRKNCK